MSWVADVLGAVHKCDPAEKDVSWGEQQQPCQECHFGGCLQGVPVVSHQMNTLWRKFHLRVTKRTDKCTK